MPQASPALAVNRHPGKQLNTSESSISPYSTHRNAVCTPCAVSSSSTVIDENRIDICSTSS
jgi:hypothetical protein